MSYTCVSHIESVISSLLQLQTPSTMAYNPDTMSFEEPNTDMVYVSGIPQDTTEEDIAAHFGSIGLLKEDKKKNKPKIWLYRDKGSNQLKVIAVASKFHS